MPQFAWPIIGHKNIVHFLQKSILIRRLHGMYLFTGPRHLGKTTLANYFISSLLCVGGNKKHLPCLKCEHCSQFFKGIHPDIYWLKRKEDQKNISIEEVREMQVRLFKSSFLNSYKFAMVREAESLSLGAVNSLLKFLEEPPLKTITILLANDIALLPPTLISRSQILRFRYVSWDEIFHYLIKEKQLTRSMSHLVSQLSLGAPGLALRFLDKKFLLIYEKKARYLLDLMEETINQRFKIIDQLIDLKDKSLNEVTSFKDIFNTWIKVTRDLILVKLSSMDLVNHIFLEEDLKKTARNFSLKKLRELLLALEDAKDYLEKNVNPHLLFENLIINYV